MMLFALMVPHPVLLDRESLFYLLSRGVHKSKAKEMLIIAFISEALDEIEDEILNQL